MRNSCVLALVVVVVVSLGAIPPTRASAIPIWELLTHEEKMGRLFYVFVHLVEQYCKTSDIPDCPKVLTLYGMSNLVSESEHSLDLMDPYQRDAKTIVWERIMRGEFKLPSKLSGAAVAKPGKPSVPSKPALDNDVYSSPYEVRVRPPAAFVPSVVDQQQPRANDAAKSDEDNSNDADSSSSKLTILRLRRSASLLDDSALPVLSEKDARLLSRIFH